MSRRIAHRLSRRNCADRGLRWSRNFQTQLVFIAAVTYYVVAGGEILCWEVDFVICMSRAVQIMSIQEYRGNFGSLVIQEKILRRYRSLEFGGNDCPVLLPPQQLNMQGVSGRRL